MNESWRTMDVVLWLWSLLIVAMSVKVNGQSQRTRSAEEQIEDRSPLSLSTITLHVIVTILLAVLGLVLFRGQFFARIRQRLNLSAKPFHWRIVQYLNLSPTWIKSFREGDGLTLVQFIDGLPITGHLLNQPLAVQARLSHDGVTGSRRLSQLVNESIWCNSKQAQELACQIASSLRDSEHLSFEKAKLWGWHAPFDGWRFDISRLSAEHKGAIEQEILAALRQAAECHPQLASMRIVAAVGDELGARVEPRADDAGAVHESSEDEEVVLPSRVIPEVVQLSLPEDEGVGFDAASHSQAESRIDDAGSEQEAHDEDSVVSPAVQVIEDRPQLPPLLSAGADIVLDEEGSTGVDPTADRLRRRYQEATFLGHRDPFEIGGQMVAHYYQSLELSVPKVVASEGEVTMDWSPLPLANLMAVRSNGVILMGEVGAGKTTLCRRIAQQWAFSEDDQAPWLRRYRYVLMIPLREWLSRFNELDIESEADRDRHVQAWLTRGLWDYCIKDITYEGPYPLMRDVLLLLDGCDEVLHAPSDSVFGQVLSRLLDRTQAEAPHVIVTTRPHVSLEERFGAFVEQARVCRIVGLPRDNQQAMVKGYFGEKLVPDSVDPARPLFSTSFQDVMRRQATLSHLQRNPLLLKMLCYLFYTQTTSQGARSIFTQRDLRLTPIYRETIGALKRRANGHLGGWEPSPEGNKILKKLANQRGGVIDPDRIGVVFNELGIHSGEERHKLLVEVSAHLGMLYPLDANPDPLDSHWSFLHKSFQEYYRALALSDRLQEDESAECAASVYAEVRVSFMEGGQLGLFLAGNLSKCPGERAAFVLQCFINHQARDAQRYFDERQSLWRVLAEVASERSGDLRLPGLTVLQLLGGLGSAAQTGSVHLCQWYVAQVPEESRLALIRQTDSQGATALHHAAFGGHESVCRWLVEQLPESDRMVFIQQADSYRRTVLHSAAQGGHELVCRWLLEQMPERDRFALIKQGDRVGRTALRYAAERGHELVCRRLLEQVPEGERLAFIKPEKMVMHLADMEGYKSFGYWLLRYYAKGVERLDLEGLLTSSGQTVLHVAAERGDESICRSLLKPLPQRDRLACIQQVGKYGSTALHLSVIEGHYSVFRFLLEQVPESDRLALIQKTNEFGRTVLYCAALGGNTEICLRLVELMPEKYRLTSIQQVFNGRTMLDHAVQLGHESVCRWLLEQVPERNRLAWVQQVSRNGHTLLHSAALGGNESLCRWLLEQVPEPERLAWIQQVDADGHTALHCCARRGHELVCRWLVDQVPESDRLAWMQLASSEGATALHYAAYKGHESVCHCLLRQLPTAHRVLFVNRRDHRGILALNLLRESKLQPILDLLPAEDRRTPTAPSRPAAGRPRGRLLGDAAGAARRGSPPTPSEGSVVGLEETKGEGRAVSRTPS